MEQTSALPDEQALADTQCMLERLIAASCDALNYSGAAWYAAQLVALTHNAPEAVYTLASCYFRNGEFGRAYHVLERAGLVDVVALRGAGADSGSDSLPCGAVHPSQLHYVYLGALCLSKMKAWERCAHLLESCMEGRGFPPLWVPLPEDGADAGCADCGAAGAAAAAARGGPMHAGSGAFPPLPSSASLSMSAGDRADAALLASASGVAAVAAQADGSLTWRALQRMSRRYRRWAAAHKGATGLPVHALNSPGRWASPPPPFCPPLQRPAAGVAVGAPHSPLHDATQGLDLTALLCQLRGDVLVSGLGNRERAAQWYLAALRLDPFCVSAAAALSEHELLSDDSRSKVAAWVRTTLGGIRLLPPGLAPPPCDPSATAAGSSAGSTAWLAASYCEQLRQGGAAPQEEGATVPVALAQSLPAQLASVERALSSHCIQTAAAQGLAAVEADPFDGRALDLAASALTQAGRADDLSAIGHAAVKRSPREPSTWHVVGCYYLTLGKYALAYKHFSRAVACDAGHAPSWMGSGLCLSAQGEADAALSAFRVARRLRPFSPLPPLALGVSLARTGQAALAAQALDTARALAPQDPAVYHELGVIEYRAARYENALTDLQSAVELLYACGGVDFTRSDEARWEATYSALGHVYRKLGRYTEALSAYEKALSLLSLCGARGSSGGAGGSGAGLLSSPQQLEGGTLATRTGSLLAAIAFTHQLAGAADEAVVYYHAALARIPEDPLCQRQLVHALAEAAKAPLPRQPGDEEGLLPPDYRFVVEASTGNSSEGTFFDPTAL